MKDLKIIGKVDTNRTVQEVMDATPRTGALYLDLKTGTLLGKADSPEDVNEEKAEEKRVEDTTEKKEVKPAKKDKKKK